MKTFLLTCLLFTSLFITAQTVNTFVNTDGVLLKDNTENDRIDIDGAVRCITIVRDDTSIFKLNGAFPTSLKLINFNNFNEVGMEVDGDGAFAFGEFGSAPVFSRFPVTNIQNGLFRPTDNNVGLATGFQERLRITNTGDIGIGTIAPTARLDVDGRLRVRVIDPDEELPHVLVVNDDGLIFSRFMPNEPFNNNPIATEELMEVIALQNQKINDLEARLARVEELEAKLNLILSSGGTEK